MTMYLFASAIAASIAGRALAAPACYNNFQKSQFPNCVVLGSRIALHWSVAHEDASTITFGVDAEVSSKSGSWVGVGISDMGGNYFRIDTHAFNQQLKGMRGTDSWILMQKDDGSYVLQDSFSEDYVMPLADKSQDVTLLAPPQPSDTNTVFTFQRPIKSCDIDDIEIQKGIEHNIVWAIGTSKSFGQHSPTNRGDAKAILHPDHTLASIEKTPQPADLQEFEIRMPNITIPSNRTSYLCTHFSMPSETKYHVIRVQGLPESKYIHHMIVYGCSAPPVAPAADGDVYDCGKMDAACGEFTFSWVPGSSGSSYPDTAGIPIGVGENANRYFSLQVHYNNPEQDAGVVDRSGIKVWYTKTLRKYDVGVLTLGSISISIPPNSLEPTVLKPNLCPSTCTSKFPGPITLLSSGIHMHNLGLNQTTQRFRDGKELSPLITRRFYDFNYQGQTAIANPEATTLLPRDSLLTTCAYRPTPNSASPTTFGEETTNEMCFNFIQYYPKYPPIEYCMTIDRISQAICSTKARLSAAGLSGVSSGGEGGANQTAVMEGLRRLMEGGDLVASVLPRFERYEEVCLPSVRNATMPVATTTAIGKPSAGGRAAEGFGVGVGIVVLGAAALFM
ncbi:hypothetical protein HDU67_009752 [Dinochytrium kinnereticum]|nr:hypothetical protein HDU67_009752 [Dinochytrium kinnereticum]